MIQRLLLCLGLLVAAGPAAQADSIVRLRDSLLMELKRTESGDYARTKELSEKLNALEKRAVPVPQGRTEKTDAPLQDLFQLQALEVVLQARIKKCETRRDSLMGLLTELHLGRDNAFPDSRNGFGVDPREGGREPIFARNPDTEKQKALTVQHIDSLKIEIKSLMRQQDLNRTHIQTQLKGKKP